MVFEAGPYVVRDPLPLAPRIVQPGTFGALAADFPFIGSSVDAALATHARDLAPYVNRVVDPLLDTALAVALDGLDALAPASDAAALSDIHAAIDAVLDDVAIQAADLPGPDEPDPTSAAPPTGEPDPGDLFGEPRPTPLPPGPLPPVAPDVPPTPAPGPGPTLPPIAPQPVPVDVVRAAVRQLYLELLAREPDAGGWDNWTYAIVSQGRSLDWVRAQLVASDEYRALHGGD